jgi:hypothetical protein
MLHSYTTLRSRRACVTPDATIQWCEGLASDFGLAKGAGDLLTVSKTLVFNPKWAEQHGYRVVRQGPGDLVYGWAPHSVVGCSLYGISHNVLSRSDLTRCVQWSLKVREHISSSPEAVEAWKCYSSDHCGGGNARAFNILPLIARFGSAFPSTPIPETRQAAHLIALAERHDLHTGMCKLVCGDDTLVEGSPHEGFTCQRCHGCIGIYVCRVGQAVPLCSTCAVYLANPKTAAGTKRKASTPEIQVDVLVDRWGLGQLMAYMKQ